MAYVVLSDIERDAENDCELRCRRQLVGEFDKIFETSETEEKHMSIKDAVKANTSRKAKTAKGNENDAQEKANKEKKTYKEKRTQVAPSSAVEEFDKMFETVKTEEKPMPNNDAVKANTSRKSRTANGKKKDATEKANKEKKTGKETRTQSAPSSAVATFDMILDACEEEPNDEVKANTSRQSRTAKGNKKDANEKANKEKKTYKDNRTQADPSSAAQAAAQDISPKKKKICEAKRVLYAEYTIKKDIGDKTRYSVSANAHEFMINELCKWQVAHGLDILAVPVHNEWYLDIRVEMIKAGLLSKAHSQDVVRSYLKGPYLKNLKISVLDDGR